MKDEKQASKSVKKLDAKEIRLSNTVRNLSSYGVKAIGIVGFEPVKGPYLKTYIVEDNISDLFLNLLKDPAFVTELSVLGKWIKYFVTLKGTHGFIHPIDEIKRKYLIAELETKQKDTALDFLKRLAKQLKKHSGDDLKTRLNELLS